MKDTIVILNNVLDKRQKRNLVILFFLILIGAALETVGVSAIIPLVSAILSPDFFTQYAIVGIICDLFKIKSNNMFIVFLMVVIAVIFVLKGIYMVFLNYVQYRFIYNGQVKTTTELFDAFMRKDYEFYLNTNYNYVSKIVRHDVADEYNLLLCIVKFMTEAVVFIILSGLLFVIDYQIALVIVALMVLVVCCIFFIVKPIMKRSGDIARQNIVQAEKWLYQGINGIKDVKIAQKENFFVNNYEVYQQKYSKSQRTKSVVGDMPAYIIESISIVGVLAYLVVLILSGRDVSQMLPQISAFAVAAIRLLPSANRMNSYINNMTYYKSLLKDLDVQFEEIGTNRSKEIKPEKSVEKKNLEKIKNNISMRNITFAYQESPQNILEDAELEIPVGKSVAIVGASGAGKTTAVDLILGLLNPQQGEVKADGIDIMYDYSRWLSHIGYIPQFIYLTDDSIKNNVAFGLKNEEIDEGRVWEVLEEAQIADFIRELPNGINTEIGDRGVRLSGGQRQRLGIARALYDNPDILIFDEATSALDNETEAAIMESINYFKGRKTMVIIAHRLATVENCDIQYRVIDKKIIREK